MKFSLFILIAWSISACQNGDIENIQLLTDVSSLDEVKKLNREIDSLSQIDQIPRELVYMLTDGVLFEQLASKEIYKTCVVSVSNGVDEEMKIIVTNKIPKTVNIKAIITNITVTHHDSFPIIIQKNDEQNIRAVPKNKYLIGGRYLNLRISAST